MARQTWPALTMAPRERSSAATSFGSTSSSTMAASLPPSSRVRRFRVLGDAGHHLLAGRGGAGEGDLGDVGMGGQVAAQVVLVGDDVDARPAAGSRRTARRSCSVVSGVVGAGLATTVLPASSAGRDLDHQQDHREVPRRDRRDDAQRRALLHDACAAVVLQHLGRQVHGGEGADHVDGAADLAAGACASGLPCSWVRRRANRRMRGVEGVGQLSTAGGGAPRSVWPDQAGKAALAAATA